MPMFRLRVSTSTFSLRVAQSFLSVRLLHLPVMTLTSTRVEMGKHGLQGRSGLVSSDVLHIFLRH
jgi:hypothetical protein